MRIESGPTGERKIRNLIMLIMFAAMGGWFAYDGFWGYPAENFEECLQQLPEQERAGAKDAPIYPTVSKDSMLKARTAVREAKRADRRRVAEDVLGGPPSHETSDAWFYFGSTFWIKISPDKKNSIVIGRETEKSALDILLQKLLALALGLASVWFLWHWIRVLRTRLVLDDGGLTYRGEGPIRWEDMKSLDTERFCKKGWVDLIHDDHGTERALRLDEYHLAKFDDVIDQVCARKGFENPLPVEADEDDQQPG